MTMQAQSLGSNDISGEKFWKLMREHEQADVPEAYITTSNPAYEKWIERAGLILCLDAGECGVIPTPCSNHLSMARRLEAARRTILT